MYFKFRIVCWSYDVVCMLLTSIFILRVEMYQLFFSTVTNSPLILVVDASLMAYCIPRFSKKSITFDNENLIQPNLLKSSTGWQLSRMHKNVPKASHLQTMADPF